MTSIIAEYDVFISHASEDKSGLARPLAHALEDMGVRVWYDETCLQIGDSLMRSIDAGLARSRFGVVLLSKSFLSKPWPEYELRGLVTREMGKSKLVLPVWNGVTRDEVIAFSPPLADKFALQHPERSIAEIALAITRVARPEIARHINRQLAWRKKLAKAKRASIPRSALRPSPIRHVTLPPGLVTRLKLVHQTFGDVMHHSLADSIENFKRDATPSDEVAIWERMAVAFAELTHESEVSGAERHTLFANLLRISMMSAEELAAAVQEGDESTRRQVTAYIEAALEPGRTVADLSRSDACGPRS
jgi:hypothetical protein